MRLRTLVTALAVAGGLAVPQSASAIPPDPTTCLPVLELVATPAQPLVDTAVLAVGSAQVVCTRDVLTSTPIQLADWSGHISASIQVNGTTPPGCASGAVSVPAVGAVLVLPIVQTCVIPFADVSPTSTVSMVVHWATLEADLLGLGTGYYRCCDSRRVYATPVGVSIG